MSTGLFYPITIIQGESVDLKFSITDDGVGILMDDFEFTGQFKSLTEPSSVGSFEFNVDSIDSSLMHATVLVTSHLTPSRHEYEIRSKSKEGFSSVVLSGSLLVKSSLISLDSSRSNSKTSSTGFINLGSSV